MVMGTLHFFLYFPDSEANCFHVRFHWDRRDRQWRRHIHHQRLCRGRVREGPDRQGKVSRGWKGEGWWRGQFRRRTDGSAGVLCLRVSLLLSWVSFWTDWSLPNVSACWFFFTHLCIQLRKKRIHSFLPLIDTFVMCIFSQKRSIFCSFYDIDASDNEMQRAVWQKKRCVFGFPSVAGSQASSHQNKISKRRQKCLLVQQ